MRFKVGVRVRHKETGRLGNIVRAYTDDNDRLDLYDVIWDNEWHGQRVQQHWYHQIEMVSALIQLAEVAE